MTYRFRMEHYLTFKRATITVKCSDPAVVIARLARAGWIVQIHYEVAIYDIQS